MRSRLVAQGSVAQNLTTKLSVKNEVELFDGLDAEDEDKAQTKERLEEHELRIASLRFKDWRLEKQYQAQNAAHFQSNVNKGLLLSTLSWVCVGVWSGVSLFTVLFYPPEVIIK